MTSVIASWVVMFVLAAMIGWNLVHREALAGVSLLFAMLAWGFGASHLQDLNLPAMQYGMYLFGSFVLGCAGAGVGWILFEKKQKNQNRRMTNF